jgi:hypothetical protein
MREVDGRGVPEGCSWLVLLAGRRSRACLVARRLAKGKGVHNSGSQAIFLREDDLGLPATCQNLVITPSGS